MLFWLAGKQERAIRRMVECLRPGGWLVDEEGDWGMVAPVDPSHPSAAGMSELGAMVNGGYREVMTPLLDASSPRSSKIAVSKTSAMRQPPK